MLLYIYLLEEEACEEVQNYSQQAMRGGKKTLRWRHRWKNNIKVDFKELWCVQTVHEPGQGSGPFMIMVINLWMSNKQNILTICETVSILITSVVLCWVISCLKHTHTSSANVYHFISMYFV